MHKENLILIAAVILLGIAGCFLPHKNFDETNVIYIHVTGAVENTGIVSVSFGDTVQDAIDAAGGELTQADLTGIDATRKLTYAQPIDIPFR